MQGIRELIVHLESIQTGEEIKLNLPTTSTIEKLTLIISLSPSSMEVSIPQGEHLDLVIDTSANLQKYFMGQSEM